MYKFSKKIAVLAVEIKPLLLHTLFWIPGRGIGKARPRTNWDTGSIYTPERYRDWKDFAIEAIQFQMRSHILPAPQPCRIECEYVNFFSSDSDNLLGSVLDALVQAEYLENDSFSYVSECQGVFVKVRKKHKQTKPQGIIVKVFPTEIAHLEIPADIDVDFWAKFREDRLFVAGL